MDIPSEIWRAFFGRWPAEAPRRGIIITLWNEQIPFHGFLLGADFLCLERQTPDSLGGRTIVLPLAQVAGLKFTDVVKPKTLEVLGFEPTRAPEQGTLANNARGVK
jgi:hypothetical protein